MDVVRVEGLYKTYGFVKALRNVNFRVSKGQIYGYLGPNGAGKTTTIKILLDLISRDGGIVEVFGYDPMFYRERVLEHIGFTPELPSLPKFMTGLEFLVFSAVVHGFNSVEARSRARELVELVGLSEAKDRKIGKYSRDMIQRLSLANALISSPDLLILDEPALGMDPTGRVEIRKILLDVNREGTTIFLSSHILGDIERICGYIALINRGEIIYSGSLNGLLTKVGGGNIVNIALKSPVPNLIDKIKMLSYVEEVEGIENKIRVVFKDGEDHRAEISKIISRMGGTIIEMDMEIGLETILLKLMGKNGDGVN